MTTLPEFVLARIADDDAAADGQHTTSCAVHQPIPCSCGILFCARTSVAPCDCGVPASIHRWGDAGRRIVAIGSTSAVDDGSAYDVWEHTLWLMAQPDAGHADYDPRWRPPSP